jgi:hypothetical protein
MKNIKKGPGEPDSLTEYRNSLKGDYSGKTVFDDYKELSLTVLLVTFNESTIPRRVGSVFLLPTI